VRRLSGALRDMINVHFVGGNGYSSLPGMKESA
jgi:hypothetical protein